MTKPKRPKMFKIFNESPSDISKQRPSLRLRRQKLPAYPQIECVKRLELDTFVKANFKMVKYGDHEFKESLDGYVHVYVSGVEKKKVTKP